MGEKREEVNEEWVVMMVLNWAAKKKKSVLEEQMLRKQGRGKAVDIEPPSTSWGMSLGEGAQLSPGCFLSPFCILRPAAVRQGLCAPEKEEGQSKGGGGRKKRSGCRKEQKEEMSPDSCVGEDGAGRGPCPALVWC